jgi:NAD(P)-dependent dehydrogenase (short-subunit alcohol dehydrogenase family)
MPIDKVVLITGSSTGFGRDAAETLARRGYTVFASMRDCSGKNAGNKQALERIAKEEDLALFVPDLDVTSDDSVEAAVQEIASQSGGRIDVVINNAGIASLGITEGYTISQWQRMFDVNLFGVVRVNRAVLPVMRRQGSGLLIHVSSAAGRGVAPYFGMYSASKFALEALADSYRFELKPFGIDSVLVEPGIHKTPILEAFIPPEDQRVVAEYPPETDYTSRVRAVFDQASASPDTPGAREVVEAFVQLIEMQTAERPFRTVPTPAMQPLLQALNASCEDMRRTIAHVFGAPELIS